MGGPDKFVEPSLVEEGITFASTMFVHIDVCEDVTVQIFIFYVHLYRQYNDKNMKTA